MNCIELISEFLNEININNYENSLNKILSSNEEDYTDCPYSEGKILITRILTDIYKLNSDNVKKCSRKISEKFSPLGRTEKDILKHYYDYSDSSSLKKLISVAGITNENEQIFIDTVEGFRGDYSKKAVECFKKNFSVAEENNDKIKKFDYLYSLYKKLMFLLHPDKTSLHKIYEYNKSFIHNELNQSLTEKIRVFCANSEKIKSVTARHMFCDFYQNILDEDLINKSRNGELEKFMNTGYSSGTPFENIDTEKIHLIVFNINQKLYDIYGNCDTFKSAVNYKPDVQNPEKS